MVPSSSGPGRLVLIQKIAGSTPAGITNFYNPKRGLFFIFIRIHPNLNYRDLEICRRPQSLVVEVTNPISLMYQNSGREQRLSMFVVSPNYDFVMRLSSTFCR